MGWYHYVVLGDGEPKYGDLKLRDRPYVGDAIEILGSRYAVARVIHQQYGHMTVFELRPESTFWRLLAFVLGLGARLFRPA